MIQLHCGECLEVMKTLPAGSVDAVCTDPPAGISFMGREWDSFGTKGNPNAEADRDEANRGPGAGLGNQPFGYSRSGSPSGKGRSAFVDFLTPRLAEARRIAKPGAYALVWALPRTSHWTGLAVEDAGWVIRDRVSHLFATGFPKSDACLKPACEDWWLAWNPMKGITPLRIDESRIGTEDGDIGRVRAHSTKTHEGWDRPWKHREEDIARSLERRAESAESASALGRWPANVCHDGSDEVMEAFASAGERQGGAAQLVRRSGLGYESTAQGTEAQSRINFADSGSAARFFFCSKASGDDRETDNGHPTVKSTRLMAWLIGLISDPENVILDPFMGSGSTGKACHQTNRAFIGIESDPGYFAIAQKRLARQEDRYALFAVRP